MAGVFAFHDQPAKEKPRDSRQRSGRQRPAIDQQPAEEQSIMKAKLFTALGVALGLAVAGAPGAEAKDSGFKLMMTPKWTGFPYFEAAARGGKDAATELGDTFVYAGADHADPTLQVETLQNFLT